MQEVHKCNCGQTERLLLDPGPAEQTLLLQLKGRVLSWNHN